MKRCIFILIWSLWAIRLFPDALPTWEHTRLVWQNDFIRDVEQDFAYIENKKGEYTCSGWKSSETISKLLLRIKNRLPQTGTIEFTLSNFNPYQQIKQSSATLLYHTLAYDQPIDSIGTRDCRYYLRTSDEFTGFDNSQ